MWYVASGMPIIALQDRLSSGGTLGLVLTDPLLIGRKFPEDILVHLGASIFFRAFSTSFSAAISSSCFFGCVIILSPAFIVIFFVVAFRHGHQLFFRCWYVF
jgi:hypothetical protein